MQCPNCDKKGLANNSLLKCNKCGKIVCVYCRKGFSTCQTCKSGKYQKI